MPRFMNHDQAGQDGQGCENSHQAGVRRMAFILGAGPGYGAINGELAGALCRLAAGSGEGAGRVWAA
jgi:hypothetical protein